MHALSLVLAHNWACRCVHGTRKSSRRLSLYAVRTTRPAFRFTRDCFPKFKPDKMALGSWT
eukprot:1634354-Prymnesium_polylepis.1